MKAFILIALFIASSNASAADLLIAKEEIKIPAGAAEVQVAKNIHLLSQTGSFRTNMECKLKFVARPYERSIKADALFETDSTALVKESVSLKEVLAEAETMYGAKLKAKTVAKANEEMERMYGASLLTKIAIVSLKSVKTKQPVSLSCRSTEDLSYMDLLNKLSQASSIAPLTDL